MKTSSLGENRLGIRTISIFRVEHDPTGFQDPKVVLKELCNTNDVLPFAASVFMKADPGGGGADFGRIIQQFRKGFPFLRGTGTQPLVLFAGLKSLSTGNRAVCALSR